MNLVWPLALGVTIACLAPRMNRSNSDAPRWLGLLAAAAGGLAGMALLASWSRGAWLGAAAAAAVMATIAVVRLGTTRWSAPALFTALAIGAGMLVVGTAAPTPLAPDSVVARLASIGGTFATWGVADAEVTDANFATIERVAHWEAAARMWAESPLVGQGPGHYELAYERFRLPRWSAPLGHAHNYYLHALAESGLIGFAALAMLLVTLLAYSIRLALRAPVASLAFGAAVGLAGSLAAIAVHSLVDNVFVHDMTITIALAVGLAGAAESETRIPARPPVRPPR
jgi:O-antigen ligase